MCLFLTSLALLLSLVHFSFVLQPALALSFSDAASVNEIGFGRFPAVEESSCHDG